MFHSRIVYALLLFLSLVSTQGVADSKRTTVNILAWWGYLDNENALRHIQAECPVTISLDEYFSNAEFLRRWKSSDERYDLIIYSDTIERIVRGDVEGKGTSIKAIAREYPDRIQKEYNLRKYPNNTVFFIHSLTGFLWNKKVVSLNEKDDVKAIFRKAKGRLITLVDDPIEIAFLSGKSQGVNLDHNVEKNHFAGLYDLVAETKVLVTNEVSPILAREDFAFSYTWSGDAQTLLKADSTGKLDFLVHPSLSHVSSDLLSVTSMKSNAKCVAQILTSRKFLGLLQDKSRYFSSFRDHGLPSEVPRAGLFNRLKSKILDLEWLVGPGKERFETLNTQWTKFKLKVNP